MANLKGTETEKNLWNAFAGESQARNKYMFYSLKAEEEGLFQVAKVFKDTAHQEETHASIIFNFLSGIKDTVANLKEASLGELYEAETLYKEYSKVAEMEGFTEIAKYFSELSKIEAEHYRRYTELIKSLKNPL